MNLKELIIDKAKELNIDIIGITNADKVNYLENFLEDRFNKGYATEFEENDINLRITPQIQLKDGKSIIVIGISYNVDFKSSNNIKYKGRLSKSSWGIDYHVILKDKLLKLANEILEVKEFNYKVFVDTGPLIDREIAKRSGIGWYGKNCSIINEDYGSFIFIGYLITDLDIEKDKEKEENCGECDLCIKACPTGAIYEKYKINTKKCISYLTQTKNKIPYELRDLMGFKIYGCDTCQVVCPKNKGLKKSNNIEFIPKVTNGYIDIEELLNISNRDFKKKYNHISGSWRGKNILKRNAIIALGNMKYKDSIPLLIKCLSDNSSLIREYAAYSLMKIDRKEGKIIIKKSIKKEKDELVKSEMENVIKHFDV